MLDMNIGARNDPSLDGQPVGYSVINLIVGTSHHFPNLQLPFQSQYYKRYKQQIL